MPELRGILDRIILVVSVIAAGCIPSFIAQYRQRLGGRLDQVLHDLAPFQEIANRYHGGSLQALIKHHLDSTDNTFHAEGAAIQAMVDSAASLRAGFEALNTDLLHQLTYLGAQLDPGIARATWEVYAPSFTLTAESVAFSAILGIFIWLAFLALWMVCARAGRAVLGSQSRPAGRF
jgi:Protein of unknown function (DUF2937)